MHLDNFAEKSINGYPQKQLGIDFRDGVKYIEHSGVLGPLRWCQPKELELSIILHIITKNLLCEHYLTMKHSELFLQSEVSSSSASFNNTRSSSSEHFTKSHSSSEDDSPSSSEVEFDVDFLCPICKQPRKDDRWCQYCESQKFSENFTNWTSGNADLDEFIRDTQRKAGSKVDYLLWIEYEMFEDVKFLAQGGFGDVYYAVWVNGPDRRLVYDKEDRDWKIIAHDVHLALNICLGLRPNKVRGAPIWYVELMEKCWNDDPNERPSMTNVRLILNKQAMNLTEEEENAIGFPTNTRIPEGNFVGNGDIRKRIESSCFWKHPRAVYTSRLLPIINASEEDSFVRGISGVIPELSQLIDTTSDMPTKEANDEGMYFL
ncbi:2161_t:CDS:2 [Acaulospora colombiana]|uniref:2161_t:CDS:1 n=1 Tax=Acaulospora colombiana TaxID=27376 RepID=A0ACA9KJ90_9GLOM|nr:2161_t:CDS:2 [Acaulospora colombiana]